MATSIKWAGNQYSETLSASGAYTVIGLDRHVTGASVSISPASAGTYFALVTDSSVAAIEADTAKWHDLFGDGVTAQTLARAIDLEGSNWTGLMISKQSGATGTVAFSVVIKRKL